MEPKIPEESREVATRTPSTMDIIAQVSAMPPDSGDRVALMERLIAMKYADEDRQSRLAFESAFAKMRGELPSIKKTKEVKRGGGQHMYNYAPLEEIQKVCDPILQAHGFSYSWREEAIEGGKRVWFDLFGYGHTKANCFDAPLLGAKTSREGSEITNAVQGARMTSSYAKRNSMVDGLGLIIEDEDEDGASIEIDAELQTALEKMRKADNLDTLMDVYKIAYTRYEKETNFLKLVVGEYNLDKMALSRKPHA
jgi:hypothetical protein